MTHNFTTENGSEVDIEYAGFRCAMKLKDCMLKAALKADINLAGIDIDNFSKNIDSLIKVLISIDSDSEYQKALFEGLKKSRFNKESITLDLLEAEKEAGDSYYEIVIEYLKINIAPLFKSPLSKFFKSKDKKSSQESQESKTA